MVSTATGYVRRTAAAIRANRANLLRAYRGREGALKFAREFGYGLNDFSAGQHARAIKMSYKALCIGLYGLHVPKGINETVWRDAVKSQIEIRSRRSSWGCK